MTWTLRPGGPGRPPPAAPPPDRGGRPATRGRAIGGGLLVLALCVVPGPAAPADVPADAAHGKALFEEAGCGRCHRPQGREPGMGPPLEEVRRPQGELELAGRLWNHAPAMFASLTAQGLRWPELTREQMGDLMAYLQAEAGRDPAPDPARGQAVLIRKGCLKCHRLRGEGGATAIELAKDPARYESPSGWAATVWNHAPRMAGQAAQGIVLYPRFSGDEMNQLFRFLKASTAASR